MKKYFLLLLVAVFIYPQLVQAESTIWSKIFSGSFYVTNMQSAYKRHSLENPNLQIKYNARAVNVDTGQTLACGSKVAPGTKVRFEFLQHAYTDVAWFGTGSSYDSPYGSWNENAGRSGDSICAEKNFYMITLHTHKGKYASFKPGDAKTMESIYRLKNYMEFSVNPPVKTVTGLADIAGCQVLENGNAECQVNEEKILTATFNFGETFSHMFYGFKAQVGTDKEQCYSTANPLSRTQNATYSITGAGRGARFTTTPATSEPIKLTIPAQTIACQISVAGSLTNTPPNAPTVRVNDSEASCISGATISYSATARDADTNPDDSQIRYLIDWDADGSADQIMPSVGYVPSNTPQTFSFVTRADEPEQTFKVAAQDKGGLLSQWSTFTAARCENEKLIIDPNQLDADELLDGSTGTGPAGTIDSFTFNPKLTNTTCRATWAASNVTQCELYKNNTKFKDVGTGGVEDLEPGTYELRCRQASDGTLVKASQTCTRNPGFREI
jgi:hypothetical protein